MLGWDGVRTLLSSGSWVRSAEAETFLPPDLECPPPASGALVVYHDDNYGLPKVSYRPPSGFFTEGRGADMVRLAEAYRLTASCRLLQLLYVVANAPEHVIQWLLVRAWEVAGRYEEVGGLLERLSPPRRGRR